MLTYNNLFTGATYTFTVTPGSSNVTEGSIPNGPYNIEMVPSTSTSPYNIIYNMNGLTANYYGVIEYGNIMLTGTCTVTASLPPNTAPVVASNTTNKSIVLTFNNLSSGTSYSFTVAPGSSNVTEGWVPTGEYNIIMTPNNYSPSYNIIYTMNGLEASYYATVEFGDITLYGCGYLGAMKIEKACLGY